MTKNGNSCSTQDISNIVNLQWNTSHIKTLAQLYWVCHAYISGILNIRLLIMSNFPTFLYLWKFDFHGFNCNFNRPVFHLVYCGTYFHQPKCTYIYNTCRQSDKIGSKNEFSGIQNNYLTQLLTVIWILWIHPLRILSTLSKHLVHTLQYF